MTIRPKRQWCFAALCAGTGGGLAILVMILIAQWQHMPLTMVPFVTSIVLVMAAPEAPPAHPRRVIGGHGLSALAGIVTLTLLGSSMFATALAVGMAIILMRLTDTLHPPAGINAFVVVQAGLPWTFLLNPALSGAILLVGFAAAFHAVTGFCARSSGKG